MAEEALLLLLWPLLAELLVTAGAAQLLLLLLSLVVLRRFEMLMHLGSCRGEAGGCVAGGLRGACTVTACPPFFITDEGDDVDEEEV